MLNAARLGRVFVAASFLVLIANGALARGGGGHGSGSHSSSASSGSAHYVQGYTRASGDLCARTLRDQSQQHQAGQLLYKGEHQSLDRQARHEVALRNYGKLPLA
jgi:hypothetical protein